MVVLKMGGNQRWGRKGRGSNRGFKRGGGTSEVVSFAGAGVKMEEQFTNFEAKWGRRRTKRCSAAGTGVGGPESFMNWRI